MVGYFQVFLRTIKAIPNSIVSVDRGAVTAIMNTMTVVPLGIGEMSLSPKPIFPSIPELISYAGALGISPGLLVVAATPTPWLSSTGGGLPFPFTITF